MFAFFGGKLQLETGPNDYRPSEDSLWLAYLLPPVLPGALVCDAGCGTGAVGLAYASQRKSLSLYGFDRDPAMIDAAIKSAKMSCLKPCYFKLGDVRTPPFEQGIFALSFANPPFFSPKREKQSPKAGKNKVHTAHVPLTKWLDCLIYITQPNGTIGLICHTHDGHSLMQHASFLGCSLTHIYPLISKKGADAKRVVFLFKKNKESAAPTTKPIHTYTPSLRHKALGDAR